MGTGSLFLLLEKKKKTERKRSPCSQNSFDYSRMHLGLYLVTKFPSCPPIPFQGMVPTESGGFGFIIKESSRN